jgi:GT2 family glycosyltransferase
MGIHRRVLDAIGGFDPRLGLGTPLAFSDIDFAARASMAGFFGAFVPDLVVLHHHGYKPGPDVKRRRAENDYARGAYYAKFILMGHSVYLREWTRRALFHQSIPYTSREIRGALRYLRVTFPNIIPSKQYPFDDGH